MEGLRKRFEGLSGSEFQKLIDVRTEWPEARFQGRILGGLLALAFVLRVVHWKLTAVMYNDGPTYIDTAIDFYEGNWAAGFSAVYHPAYSFLIYLMHFLISDWETAGVMVSILAGTLSVACLYTLLRCAFGLRVAWLGALVYAVQPYAVRFSADVQSEGLYFLFFLGAAALLWRGFDEGRMGLVAGAGALSGLAYLTRPEGLGVVVVAFVVAAVLILRRELEIKRGVGICATLVLSAFLVMAPYLHMLWSQEGSISLTRKKSVSGLVNVSNQEAPKVKNARLELNKEERQEEKAARQKKKREVPMGQRIQKQNKIKSKYRVGIPPGRQRARPPWETSLADRSPRGLERLSENLKFLWICVYDMLREGFSTQRIEMAFALIGIFILGGRPGKRGWFLLGFPLVYFSLLLLLRLEAGYVSNRHVYPVLIFLSGYAALGIPSLGRLLLTPFLRDRDWSERKIMRRSLYVGIAILLCFSLGKQLRPYRGTKLAERQVAQWVQEQGWVDPLVFSSRSRVAFYADVAYVPMRALGKIRKGDDNYYVIIQDEARPEFPALEKAIRKNLMIEIHCDTVGENRACVLGRTGADSITGTERSDLKEGDEE